MDVAGLLQALQESDFGAWARGSSYAYPVANLAHLLGLVLLVGGIGLLDLRLAGFWRRLPASEMARVLIPLALAGLVLMPLSGFVMFAADAATLARSAVFRGKLVLIGAGLINALAFHLLFRRRPDGWDDGLPLVGRGMALASVALWLAVAALGRLIAYS